MRDKLESCIISILVRELVSREGVLFSYLFVDFV
jgi:hypothetical protein